MTNTEIFYRNMLSLIYSGKTKVGPCRRGLMAEAYDIDRYALTLMLEMIELNKNPEKKTLARLKEFKDFLSKVPEKGKIIEEFNPITNEKYGVNVRSDIKAFNDSFPIQSEKNPALYYPSEHMVIGAVVPKEIFYGDFINLEHVPTKYGQCVVHPNDIITFPFLKGMDSYQAAIKYSEAKDPNASFFWSVESSKKLFFCDESGKFEDDKLAEVFDNRTL